MAIVQEHILVGETDFIRTYSDIGMMIRGGSPESDYPEATDPASFGRTYTETNIPIDDDVDDTEALSILLGGAI